MMEIGYVKETADKHKYYLSLGQFSYEKTRSASSER